MNESFGSSDQALLETTAQILSLVGRRSGTVGLRSDGKADL